MRSFLPFALLSIALIAARLDASEEKARKRLEECINAMSQPDRPKRTDPTETGVQALLSGGPLEGAKGSAVLNSFKTVVEDFGKPVRFDLLGNRIYGAHGQVFYLTIAFKKGVVFVRMVAHMTPENETVISFFTMSPDPALVLPQELLAPENLAGPRRVKP